MKLTVNSNTLKDSVNKLISVVDKKNARPILSNCLFLANNGTIILTATDLEVSAKIIINAQIQNEGSFCINTKNLSDILRELPSGELSLEIQNNNILKLESKNIDYNLLITNADEFPNLNFQNNNSQFFQLKSNQILNIINKTYHAISTDETRLYLNGIFLQQIDSKLRAVAIDGHRLALLDTNEFLGNATNLIDGVIIPRKGINELKKLAESYPEDNVNLAIDESFLYINANDSYFLSIRLIAREYPKYQTVIPSKTAFRLITDRNSLVDAVKRIKLLSNEKTNGIKISIQKDNLILSANHPALGHAKEIVNTVYSGETIDIGFNAKYLIESLSALPEGDIQVEFNNELTPVVVKSDLSPDYLGIVMPLKL
jgi:DNA polymerase III subunit beta